ncbi:MAG: GNAT family N-acetyltransferase [Meiothermus sp.]|nr:GNAT family N-acetyltransferase [Meiothermus sp.]
MDHLTIRPYTVADFPQLLRIQRECFPAPYPEEQLWSLEQIASHVRHFPEGALCAEVGGELIASSTALIKQWQPGDPPHTFYEASDHGFIRNHDPSGNSLYGIDIAVRPEWRGRGVARRLYEARYALVRQLKLERFLTAGRIPGYHLVAGWMTPEEYVQRVIAGELTDPTVSAQLRNGLEPVGLLRGYLEDAESHNCALLMQWRNPEFDTIGA